MAESIKRYQWKLLAHIYDKFNCKVDFRQLESDKNWEEWKSIEIKKLLQKRYLKEVESMINSQSKIIVMTQKGKRTVRRYRKMYSDSNYAINLSKGTDNGILNESISKKNEAIPSNFDTEKTASYNYIKAGILVILILWCFISFLWEAFINHNKAALLIWLFLCVVFTIFSRRS